MIRQDDKRLRDEIQKWGCYLMCLIYFVNKYKNIPVSTDMINSLFDELLEKKYIDHECTVLNPNRILSILGMNATYHDRHDEPEKICLPNEFEILYFRTDTHSHFVCGDGRGYVTYDPMGVSNTVRNGRLISKRIFSMG